MSGVLPIAANISTLFRELPLLERFDAARSHGFDGVEIQLPTPSRRGAGESGRAAGMPVVLINVPSSRGASIRIAGGPISSPVPSAARTSGRIRRGVGASLVHVLAGLAPARRTARNAFAHTKTIWISPSICCVPRSRPLDRALEPIDAPGYLLSSFDAARSILSRRAPESGCNSMLTTRRAWASI